MPAPRRVPVTAAAAIDHRSRRSSVLKKLALAALAAGAVAAVRKRSGGGKGEADLWAEATSGPGSVSTPRS
jgi:hypothetical protein